MDLFLNDPIFQYNTINLLNTPDLGFFSKQITTKKIMMVITYNYLVTYYNLQIIYTIKIDFVKKNQENIW